MTCRYSPIVVAGDAVDNGCLCRYSHSLQENNAADALQTRVRESLTPGLPVRFWWIDFGEKEG